MSAGISLTAWVSARTFYPGACNDVLYGHGIYLHLVPRYSVPYTTWLPGLPGLFLSLVHARFPPPPSMRPSQLPVRRSFEGDISTILGTTTTVQELPLRPVKNRYRLLSLIHHVDFFDQPPESTRTPEATIPR
ncbi:hypothetical protein BO70DRAFT_50390 [Aspergillus heteromorphus CBS 117.55]|uniref:Uncharacterized protein n=1 Tax=Aspergillus heteromorphus CBS 117.55 TaxID=1448321 RepID=A0A317W1T1_9EURO|nr:uncharacterized protein BO70DRAFT_50390 [Aspergillus heteromorphus CBS 117.55]PWY79561.1 hypothetical protein BO70DRAFT_50390 [Aspergillus heteromorphus CBS 117.55]